MISDRITLSLLLSATSLCGAGAATLLSPNHRVALDYQPEANTLTVGYAPNEEEAATSILQIVTPGIITDHGECAITDLGEVATGAPVSVDYTMLTGKRSHCTNEYTEYRFTAPTEQGATLQLVCRLYNDGVALRYEMENLPETKIKGELTGYRITEGTNRYMQDFKADYENYFPHSQSGESSSHHWGYPALVNPQNTNAWALITEAGIEATHSASSLWNNTDVELFKVTPDRNDLAVSGSWHSPWRVIIVGENAGQVAESTLVTDLSEPSAIADTSWIQPGAVSWVYWAYNHGSKDFQIVKKYVDMAATMHLPYVLIDWEWDVMENGGTLIDAVNYAKSLGVKPLLWYNSSTGWVGDGAPGPLYRLNTPEAREKEFAWLEEIGVAGVKIDFFPDDTQASMAYYIDLLKDAARHHLLVNFHGATLPRGWQRTYPNLMSTEGVKGAEWYNIAAEFTKNAASHNVTLPFTRNVVGPMDYTPCAFSDSQHPHITTAGHELALTVAFESALQHIADSPESLLAQPKAVQDFFATLPTTWDETRFLDSHVGATLAVARRKGSRWYIACLNGTDRPTTISLYRKPKKKAKPVANPLTAELTDLFVTDGHTVTTFGDCANGWNITTTTNTPLPQTVTLPARGGITFIAE